MGCKHKIGIYRINHAIVRNTLIPMDLVVCDSALTGKWAAMPKKNRPAVVPYLGAVVRQHRDRLGLTQKELAARAGDDRTTRMRSEQVSSIERGENVTVDQLHRVSLALGFEDEPIVSMLRADAPPPAVRDPQTEMLLGFWSLVKHPAGRTDVLELIGRFLAQSKEQGARAIATSGADPAPNSETVTRSQHQPPDSDDEP